MNAPDDPGECQRPDLRPPLPHKLAGEFLHVLFGQDVAAIQVEQAVGHVERLISVDLLKRLKI